MQFQKILVPLASVALVVGAYRFHGGAGVAVAIGALVMWLLHVVAMTQSLGALQSPEDTQPELLRWTDGTQSQVTCEFQGGKLKKWALERPEPADEAPDNASASPAP